MTTELEWRRRWKPDIGAKAWQQFEIDGEVILVKICTGNDCYEFLINDFKCMWHERLEGADVTKRSKKLNPSVEAPLGKLLQHIRDHVESQKKGTQYEVGRKDGEETQLVFTINTTLAGLPYKWLFRGQLADQAMVARHMTLPLLGMVGELLRRQEEMTRLLVNKDKEIDDYKSQGARVSRKHLETTPFDVKVFSDDMVTSRGFAEGVHRLGQSAFLREGPALYTDIMTKHCWLTTTARQAMEGDSLMEEESLEPAAAGGASWSNRIPTSLIPTQTQTSPRKSPAVSPIKSPAKSPGASNDSPTKDSDLLRRQALQRRLEMEEEKKEAKAKKKKKIKF